MNDDKIETIYSMTDSIYFSFDENLNPWTVQENINTFCHDQLYKISAEQQKQFNINYIIYFAFENIQTNASFTKGKAAKYSSFK